MAISTCAASRSEARSSISPSTCRPSYEWAGATFAEADPSWNDVKIRGKHKPLGGRWDRVTLFVNRQGATSGPNPPLGGDEGITFAIWGPWQNGAL